MLFARFSLRRAWRVSSMSSGLSSTSRISTCRVVTFYLPPLRLWCSVRFSRQLRGGNRRWRPCPVRLPPGGGRRVSQQCVGPWPSPRPCLQNLPDGAGAETRRRACRHTSCRRSGLSFLSDLNHGRTARPGEFERVGKEVLEDLLYQRGIALHEGQIVDLPLHLPAGTLRLEFGDYLVHERIQTGYLQPHFVAANPAQVQQIIDQQSHAPRTFLNPLQMVLGPGRQAGTVFLGQNLGEPADMP